MYIFRAPPTHALCSPSLFSLCGNLEGDRVLPNVFHKTLVSNLLVEWKKKSFATVSGSEVSKCEGVRVVRMVSVYV